MLPLRARVDLGAMTIKGYSAFLKVPALLEPHHECVLCHIQDIRWWGWGGVLPFCRDVVGIYHSPSQLGHVQSVGILSFPSPRLVFIAGGN